MELDSDVTRQNDNRMTPLGVAVTKGAQSVVEYFFEVGEIRLFFWYRIVQR